MKLFKINIRLFPHKHKLRIVDCKMERNGQKLYGVICSKCLTIVEAGVTFEQAAMVVRMIKSGNRFIKRETGSEILSPRLTIPVQKLHKVPENLAQ
jgi:hypothetical protein